jgi:hypothetical protein
MVDAGPILVLGCTTLLRGHLVLDGENDSGALQMPLLLRLVIDLGKLEE